MLKGFQDDLEIYAFCLYHSVLIFGINEMGPVNINELTYSFMVLILTSIVSNFVLSEMAVILTTIIQAN